MEEQVLQDRTTQRHLILGYNITEADSRESDELKVENVCEGRIHGAVVVDGADEEEGEQDQDQHQTTCQKSVRREIYVKIIFSFGEISNFQHMICIYKIFL